MSDHRLIKDISNALRTLLASGLSEAGFHEPVEIKQPPDGGSTEEIVSFWLYHITENEFVKNQPLINHAPSNGGNGGTRRAKFPPLSINLYYLITPMVDKGIKDQELLGKLMELLYDNAIVFVRVSDQSLHELRISLCRMTLEEQTRVWDALRQAYRLSVCYQVRVAQIDSLREQNNARIVEQVTGTGPIPADSAGGAAR